MDGDNVHLIDLPDDADPLEHVLRFIEAEVDQHGWDKDPIYLTLHWAELPPEVGLAFLTAASLQLPVFCYTEPGLYLLPTVRLLAEKGEKFPGASEAYASILGPGFYGVGMVFEAWTLPPSVSEEETRAASRSRTIDQHPERIEERLLMAVTVDGRIGTVKRTRGEEATYHELDPAEEELRGTIPTALRILCNHLQEMADLYAATPGRNT